MCGRKKQYGNDVKKKISNFTFFFTSTDIGDTDTGSEINITTFNLMTTLFYLDIGLKLDYFQTCYVSNFG